MDLACETTVNMILKSILRMIRKKALERWEMKLDNTEAMLQEIWPIAK
jgi:hypothetical protein